MFEAPSFSGSGMQKARAIFDWVEARIKHMKITPAELLRMGMMTPNQIASRGRAASALGCLDKVALSAALLKENGFQTWIVTERICLDGKPTGIHFMVEGTDGKVKFTVDPRIYDSYFHTKWLGPSHAENLSTAFQGKTKCEFVRASRAKVANNPMAKTAFRLAGIKNRRHCLKIAGVKAKTFAKYTLSRFGPKFDQKIRNARKIARRRH